MSTRKLSLFLLRVGMGWLFFYAGYSKVVTFFTEAADWSAAGFISGLKGPFAYLFTPLAGNIFIDYLNAYGLLLLGVCVLLGVFLRAASFGGLILMSLYYLAGFPPDHAFLVEEHVMYSLVLILLSAYGAGRVWGLDPVLEKSATVKSNRWLLKVLG